MRSILLNFVLLVVQRLKKSNKISSLAASPWSLAGCHITVGRWTHIDRTSSVGSYTYIGDSCYVTRAHIGRYVSIGNNVSIGPGEHDLNRLSTSTEFYENAYHDLTRGECIIESDAWVGVDAIVLRGVRIGIGAVVAANSVVTKDVPDYAVVAGVPAKLVKFRFEEEGRTKLIDSRWWEKDKREAGELLARLNVCSQ